MGRECDNVNATCTVVYFIHVAIFEGIMYVKLLCVETNHRQALLQEVALVRRDDGFLCVSTLSLSIPQSHHI